jgi:predicted short-subunit dehydrogenase-like oxidoreductase (DUF2520 family)
LRQPASGILPAVPNQRKVSRPTSVSIVGPGNLGTALALTLSSAGWKVKFIAVRSAAARKRKESRELARRVGAKLVRLGRDPLDTDVVWIAVPDDAILLVAEQLAGRQSWSGRIVFHSSGALTSDQLAPLQKQGAKVASVHPGMTFVRSSVPRMAGVAFAIEGDAAATRLARDMVRQLHGTSYSINKRSKVLYHVFGSFASPLVIAMMASLERVALAAGIAPGNIKTMMVPLLWQTLRNYLKHDAALAFSGPLQRGDVVTVRKHLAELKALPEAREVYVALARAAIKNLPVKNKAQLERELGTAKQR